MIVQYVLVGFLVVVTVQKGTREDRKLRAAGEGAWVPWFWAFRATLLIGFWLFLSGFYHHSIWSMIAGLMCFIAGGVFVIMKGVIDNRRRPSVQDHDG